MSQSNPKEESVKNEALRLFACMLKAMVRSDPVDLTAAQMAFELGASLHRRIARDLGESKDHVNLVRTVASEVMGNAYEASGTGQQVRHTRESVTRQQVEAIINPRFTEKEYAEAEEMAKAALDNIMSTLNMNTKKEI